MKTKIKYYSLTIILLILFSPAAYSDRDGHSCFNDGYLAYEFDSKHEPGNHILYIIRIGADIGIGRATKIIIPKYSVFGMRCNTSEVELLTTQNIYRVTLPESGRTAEIKKIPLVHPDQRPSDFADLSRNIGWVLTPDRLSSYQLRAKDDKHIYWIEINAPFVDECTREITTKLVQRDLDNKVKKEKVLYHSQYFTECAEGPSLERRQRLNKLKPRSLSYDLKDAVLIIGSIISNDIRFIDFGEGFGGIYSGKIKINVDEAFRLNPPQTDRLKKRFTHDNGKVVAIVQYKSTTKKVWLEIEDAQGFYLYPLENTREFGLIRVTPR